MQEVYKDKLKLANEDELLINSLKWFFYESIESLKPDVGDEDNTALGEKYRAFLTAKALLAKTFDKLSLLNNDIKAKNTNQNRAL